MRQMIVQHRYEVTLLCAVYSDQYVLNIIVIVFKGQWSQEPICKESICVKKM